MTKRSRRKTGTVPRDRRNCGREMPSLCILDWSIVRFVVPRLKCRQFIEHCKPSFLQRIQPSSIQHFSRDIRVQSLGILLRGPRLSSAPMGVE